MKTYQFYVQVPGISRSAAIVVPDPLLIGLHWPPGSVLEGTPPTNDENMRDIEILLSACKKITSKNVPTVNVKWENQTKLKRIVSAFISIVTQIGKKFLFTVTIKEDTREIDNFFLSVKIY